MPAVPRIVLDTNIVLDLFVFSDPRMQALESDVRSGALCWIAAAPMRSELARVLTYAHIAARLRTADRGADFVLAQFDALVTLKPVAPKAAFTCKDADDQQFIDLALAYRAFLLSKDRAVLCMAKRLRSLGVEVATHWSVPPATQTTTLSGVGACR